MSANTEPCKPPESARDPGVPAILNAIHDRHRTQPMPNHRHPRRGRMGEVFRAEWPTLDANNSG